MPSYSPDGAAGEHKFTALKPVLTLDVGGKKGGGSMINDLRSSAA